MIQPFRYSWIKLACQSVPWGRSGIFGATSNSLFPSRFLQSSYARECQNIPSIFSNLRRYLETQLASALSGVFPGGGGEAKSASALGAYTDSLQVGWGMYQRSVYWFCFVLTFVQSKQHGFLFFLLFLCLLLSRVSFLLSSRLFFTNMSYQVMETIMYYQVMEPSLC